MSRGPTPGQGCLALSAPLLLLGVALAVADQAQSDPSWWWVMGAAPGILVGWWVRGVALRPWVERQIQESFERGRRSEASFRDALDEASQIRARKSAPEAFAEIHRLLREDGIERLDVPAILADLRGEDP